MSELAARLHVLISNVDFEDVEKSTVRSIISIALNNLGWHNHGMSIIYTLSEKVDISPHLDLIVDGVGRRGNGFEVEYVGCNLLSSKERRERLVRLYAETASNVPGDDGRGSVTLLNNSEWVPGNCDDLFED